MQESNKTPILFLDNTYTFGGAINSLLYLLRALDKKRYVPILVTGQPEEFLSKYFSFLNWHHIELKLPWVHNRIYSKIIRVKPFSCGYALKVANVIRYLYWLIFVTLPEAYQYYQIGRKYKVRLVHLNNIIGSQLAGIIAAKLLRVPCIAHLRDFEEVDKLTRMYAMLVDSHIAISKAIQSNLLDLAVPKEKISVIYDAIDLNEFKSHYNNSDLKDEFNLAGKEKLFGVFGRIIEWKGTVEFVHAAAIIIKSNPNVKAFIVGDCSDGNRAYLDEVKKLIVHYELEKEIILTGYRTDVPALMEMMDIIVHTSKRPEPFGMVLIEGMAMAKPIVATKMGGPLDIVIDGETGFLVELDGVAELANSIQLLLDDDELARTMGIKGKERVYSMFTKERYAQQVEELYSNLLIPR